MNPADIDAIVASAKKGATAPAEPPAETPQLEDLGMPMLDGAEQPLSMLLDLSLPVAIELGRTTMTVQEVLQLGRGSVVQLERLAGEPIDVFVGDRLFAQGEVVVLGEQFGVRITRILSRRQAETPA